MPQWANPGQYMWLNRPCPMFCTIKQAWRWKRKFFFSTVTGCIWQQRGKFQKKVHFLEFKADQKQVLQSFVWCLIFVTWWTLATHNLQGSYSTYITEWDYNFFFFFPLCLKMLFTRLTVGRAAFQRAVYCGVSLNNHTTQVKCLQSFKHFILRASLGNRQAKKKKIKERKKNKTKNANELFHTSACHSKLPTKKAECV